MKEPFPPHLDSDDYAKWIISSVAKLPSRAAAIRQKELEEPPLEKAFTFQNVFKNQAVAEPSKEWPEDGARISDA